MIQPALFLEGFILSISQPFTRSEKFQLYKIFPRFKLTHAWEWGKHVDTSMATSFHSVSLHPAKHTSLPVGTSCLTSAVSARTRESESETEGLSSSSQEVNEGENTATAITFFFFNRLRRLDQEGRSFIEGGLGFWFRWMSGFTQLVGSIVDIQLRNMATNVPWLSYAIWRISITARPYLVTDIDGILWTAEV